MRCYWLNYICYFEVKLKDGSQNDAFNDIACSHQLSVGIPLYSIWLNIEVVENTKPKTIQLTYFSTFCSSHSSLDGIYTYMYKWCKYITKLKVKILNKLYLFCGANYLKECFFFLIFNLNMLIYCFLNGNLQMCYWEMRCYENVHCILKYI